MPTIKSKQKTFQFECSDELKARMQRVAEACGLKSSPWVRMTLIKALEAHEAEHAGKEGG